MRIAHVIFRADANRGGAERYCDDLCRSLIARGHEIHVLASRFGKVAAGVQQRLARAHGLTRLARYQHFLSSVDAILAGDLFDVIHAHLPIHRCDVFHTHAGFESISLNEHSTSVRSPLKRMTARLSRKRRAFAETEAALLHGAKAPFVVCLSDHERRRAAALFPGAAERMVTLYPVPDDSRFPAGDLAARRTQMRRRLGLTPDQPMFLFIGQDFDRKGLSTAIRALGQMSDRRAILYVLGGGDVARFSKIAVRANAVGRVCFAGRVDNVSDYLAAADAMVLPTRHEPFGMVTVEAMLTGVPPILSSVAGSSEVVENDRTGYVIESPTDVEQWAAAMTRIMDPATHARLSAACVASRSRFSYAAHVDAIEALYQQAARRPNRR